MSVTDPEVPETTAETTEISHARAREASAVQRARDLMRELGRVPNAKERIWLVLDLFEDDLWTRGETAPLLAEVWGLHPNTVERSAATAALMLEDPANVERARGEVTTRALRRSDDIYERARLAADREAAALYAASNGALDTYGKATGAIAPQQTNVLVDLKTGGYRPEVAREVDAAVSAVLEMAERVAVQRFGIDASAWGAALQAEHETAALPAKVGR